MRAPNFSAWITARSASSAPEMPAGEAEVVLDPGRGAGLAAGGDRVEHDRARPSDAPYTAAASPAGPAPTTTRSQTAVRRSGAGRPISAGQLGVARVAQHLVAARSRPASPPGAMPSSRSSASASASSSRSIQRCGSRLRAANSRSRRVSGEYREPMIRMPAPSPISSDAADQEGPQDQVAERRVLRRPARAARPAAPRAPRRARGRPRSRTRLAGEQAELAEEAARAVDARPCARPGRPCPRRRRPCPPGRRRSRGARSPSRNRTSPAPGGPALAVRASSWRSAASLSRGKAAVRSGRLRPRPSRPSMPLPSPRRGGASSTQAAQFGGRARRPPAAATTCPPPSPSGRHGLDREALGRAWAPGRRRP